MTGASLHLATPTRMERALQRVADALTGYVEHRIAARAARRARAVELLQEQRRHAPGPRELDAALLLMGSRPR
ncbi:hypothetical protein [Microbacterium sp.]|uniref:hypothetical protein n=1 Tax=Microbacterium sp. TaxID=51671 RepID=UPI002811E767|nr:hypothetical protein [Microbacterium sp.]